MPVLEETEWKELSLRILVEDNHVVIQFGSPITHLSMAADEAKDFAIGILHLSEKLEGKNAVH